MRCIIRGGSSSVGPSFTASTYSYYVVAYSLNPWGMVHMYMICEFLDCYRIDIQIHLILFIFWG